MGDRSQNRHGTKKGGGAVPLSRGAGKKVKVKAFPYSIPSSGPGADPGVYTGSQPAGVHKSSTRR